jgi:hypothetical protein
LSRSTGPWIAGIDFPFGQARRFIETIGWPCGWADYVRHAQSLTRSGFREALNAYRKTRRSGDKEHRRQTDIAAGSVSPQKLYGVPVGLMFFEGAPRLVASNVTIPKFTTATRSGSRQTHWYPDSHGYKEETNSEQCAGAPRSSSDGIVH